MTELPDPAPVLNSWVLLKPGAASNAFEGTVHRLVQSLKLGLVAPGEKLAPERELASMLGVSRDTVREAISALVEAGYLEAKRGRYGGTFAKNPLPTSSALSETSSRVASIIDTLALRAVVEVGIVRRLARQELSRESRERLWRAHEECQGADLADYRKYDTRLHLLMGELVDAPSLVPVLADIRMRVNELLDQIPLLQPNIEHSCEQHQRIVQAILRGRPDVASVEMEEHLAGTEALLRGFLD